MLTGNYVCFIQVSIYVPVRTQVFFRVELATRPSQLQPEYRSRNSYYVALEQYSYKLVENLFVLIDCGCMNLTSYYFKPIYRYVPLTVSVQLSGEGSKTTHDIDSRSTCIVSAETTDPCMHGTIVLKQSLFNRFISIHDFMQKFLDLCKKINDKSQNPPTHGSKDKRYLIKQ